jgi:hypothetical protein
MHRNRAGWGRLVGAETAKLVTQRLRLGEPTARSALEHIRRPACRVALVAACALLAAPATAAFAQGAPKPDPDPTAQRSAGRPAPDPYQPTAGSDRTSSSTAAAPDRSPTTTPPAAAESTTPSPAPEPTPAPAPTRTPTPKASVDQRTSTTTKVKKGTSSQRTPRDAVATPAPKVRRPAPRQTVKTVVAAVASPTDRRGLLLVGLAPLALALASGSLIFLASRGGPREARP